MLLLLTFYVLWENSEFKDAAAKKAILTVKQKMLDYYKQWKDAGFLLSVPLMENVSNCVALLETLPQSTKFFKVCINIFGEALPMIIQQEVCFDRLQKIGEILFNAIVAKIAQTRRRNQGKEFIRVYTLTHEIITFKENVATLLKRMVDTNKWQYVVLYIDQLTRIAMSVSNRVANTKNQAIMRKACWGVEQEEEGEQKREGGLPGILSLFVER